MKLFVVILHYGEIAVTQNCINTLKQHDTYPKTIVVVNNTTKNIRNSLPKDVVVINNKKNLGFAAGVNVGIKCSLANKADAVCLLNNDTIIQKPFLATLARKLKEKTIGIVSPAILFRKNNRLLYDIGGRIDKLSLRTAHQEVERVTTKPPRSVDYVTGCCMLIKKEVFQKVGFFDESFFLYYEDADFCLRAREKGFDVVVVPTVSIEHELSKSAGKMSKLAIYHLLTSAILFGRKHAVSQPQKFTNRVFILFQAALFLKANPQAGKVIAKALLEI